MKLYTIPYKGKVIIYRPLQQLAFIGNRAMAELCETVCSENIPDAALNKEAIHFLRSIGFFAADEPLAGTASASERFIPTICVLFLTDACNLRCTYCYAHGGDARVVNDLPLPLARAAIDRVCRNAAEQGHERFSLCFHGGGEPSMAWPLLKDCVAHARQSPLPVTINLTSNGVWTEAQRAWILDNIDEISLSFDGMPAIQNAQRPRKSGRGSHAAVARTLHALDRKGTAYGIRVTVTDTGITRIPDIVGYLCEETGSPTFQVEPAFARGRARIDQIALRQQADFAEYFMKGYDIAARHRRHMYYSGARPWLLGSKFCGACHSALIVGQDGFLTTCYEVCDRKHELADEFIFGALDVNGAIRMRPGIRRRFLEKIEKRRQGCEHCFCFYHCAGDCPSKTFSAGERQLSGENRCELNRSITSELLARYIEEGGGVWRGMHNVAGEMQ